MLHAVLLQFVSKSSCNICTEFTNSPRQIISLLSYRCRPLLFIKLRAILYILLAFSVTNHTHNHHAHHAHSLQGRVVVGPCTHNYLLLLKITSMHNLHSINRTSTTMAALPPAQPQQHGRIHTNSRTNK